MSKLIDLSHPIAPDMPTYPGVPSPGFDALVTHETSGATGRYAPGVTFEMATYALPGNTGTYLDAPFHRHPDAADLSRLPLERLANLRGVVIDAPADGPIVAAPFAGADLRGAAVLVRTGWSQHWGGEGYFRSGPFLTAEACDALVAAGVALVGIDCANIDDMNDPARPSHTILLGAGIPIVEHLRGLDALPPNGFRLFAVPPAIAGGTSFPVRAFAIMD